MVILGASFVLLGLGYMIIPEQVVKLLGFSEMPDVARTTSVLLYSFYICGGIWMIVATRDIQRNIVWVKFAITFCLLEAFGLLYAGIRQYVELGAVLPYVVGDLVCAVFLLAFYPRPAKQTVVRTARSPQ